MVLKSYFMSLIHFGFIPVYGVSRWSSVSLPSSSTLSLSPPLRVAAAVGSSASVEISVASPVSLLLS